MNIGDMLEIWSGGRFKSTKHRVVMHRDTKEARLSIPFFVHPDHHVEVSCLDGSQADKRVNMYEYIKKKWEDKYSAPLEGSEEKSPVLSYCLPL